MVVKFCLLHAWRNQDPLALDTGPELSAAKDPLHTGARSWAGQPSAATVDFEDLENLGGFCSANDVARLKDFGDEVPHCALLLPGLGFRKEEQGERLQKFNEVALHGIPYVWPKDKSSCSV